jgi:hypothetical protein
MTAYEQAAKKYLPNRTRTLFVAEAPPSSIDRYFYFENVRTGDSLWAELMKSCFGTEFGETKGERERKEYWLRRFQDRGYRLIDSVKTPISRDKSDRVRLSLIRSASGELIREIDTIKPERIVLIKATVYEALFQELAPRFNVVNKGPLPFPGSGHQAEFACRFQPDWL